MCTTRYNNFRTTIRDTTISKRDKRRWVTMLRREARRTRPRSICIISET
jgi:hypothetical protein